jgi:hypothetical protein
VLRTMSPAHYKGHSRPFQRGSDWVIQTSRDTKTYCLRVITGIHVGLIIGLDCEWNKSKSDCDFDFDIYLYTNGTYVGVEVITELYRKRKKGTSAIKA